MLASTKHRRRLSIESLEPRAMLTVNPVVTATLSGGQLQLQGNSSSCEVEVSQTGSTTFLISGVAGTQIKFGSAQNTSESVSGVTGGLNVNLPGNGTGGGFALTNATIRGSVNVTTGSGGTEIAMGIFPGGVVTTGAVTIQGNLNITTGAGGSLIEEAALTVNQNQNLNMGAGGRDVALDFDDEGTVTVKQDFNINSNGNGSTEIMISEGDDDNAGVVHNAITPLQVRLPELVVGNNFNIDINGGTFEGLLRDMTIGTNLNINATAGSADIDIFDATVGTNTNITTSSGSDFVEIEEFESRSLNVSLGAGNDELELFDVATTIGTNLDGGPGTDALVYLAGGNSLSHLHISNFEVIS